MATSTQWQLARDAAERYERILVPAILGPAARALVEWANLRPGERVVDIGCGTGAATRLAAEKVGGNGRVAGVDVNGGMIDVARSIAAGDGIRTEWFEKSALALPFQDGEFGVALCAQTLQFIEDKARAAAEMYRVLEPGGRAVISLWCSLPESPYFHALVQAISSHISPEVAAGLRAAFSFSDADAIRTLLTGAGFRNVGITPKQLDLELPAVAEFVPRHVSATPMAAGFQAASEDARSAVIRDVTRQLVQFETAQGLRVPFREYLVTGIR